MVLRWTIARNMETVLDLIHSKKIKIEKIITKKIPLEEAHESYNDMNVSTELSIGFCINHSNPFCSNKLISQVIFIAIL